MTDTMDKIMHPGLADQPDPEFPHAPEDWTRKSATEIAEAENVVLGEDHWETVRALHEYFAKHDEGVTINLRELHDALDEKFHPKGGIKYLYLLFPGGPVAQGCRIAGIEPPAGAADRGFGSVV